MNACSKEESKRGETPESIQSTETDRNNINMLLLSASILNETNPTPFRTSSRLPSRGPAPSRIEKESKYSKTNTRNRPGPKIRMKEDFSIPTPPEMQEDTNECLICRTSYSSQTILQMHINAVHPFDQYPTDTPDLLSLQNLTLTKEEKNRFCFTCGVIFGKRKNFLRHYREIHEQIKNFVCDVKGCGASFKRSEHLSKHVITLHSMSTG